MKFIILFLLITNSFAKDVWDKDMVERGRHLVKITGCNDCHTPMYGPKEGNVPEKDWLVGNDVGFKGPWGTSYAGNLRLMVATFKEVAFINHLRKKKYLPPMPGPSIHEMNDDELKAIYAFISYLGPAGKKSPNNLPPTEAPKGPYINFFPQVDK